jgi:hypothetical protein
MAPLFFDRTVLDGTAHDYDTKLRGTEPYLAPGGNSRLSRLDIDIVNQMITLAI